MRANAVRVLHVVMALYLGASAIEMADRSGLAGDGSAIASTAETMRDMRAGEDPLGLVDGIKRATRAVRGLADAFEEAGKALN